MAHHGVVHPGEDRAQPLDPRAAELLLGVPCPVGEQRGGRVVGEPEHPHRPLGARDDDAVARLVRGHLLLQLEGADHRVPRGQVVLVRTEHDPAHAGAQPVRADDQVEALAVLRTGVGLFEQHLHLVRTLGDLDRSGPEPHLDAADVLPQRGLDVPAQHRCRLPGLIEESQSRPAPAPAVHRPRLRAGRPFRVAGVQVVGDPQVGRGLHTLREQSDEVAPGAPLRRPFDDHRRPAGPAQPDRRRHSRDPEPDHQRPLPHRRHRAVTDGAADVVAVNSAASRRWTTLRATSRTPETTTWTGRLDGTKRCCLTRAERR